MQHNVLILDFGSQYTQLIARRVRELNIFCEIFPYNHIPSDLSSYKAVILGGSPFSVRGEDAPHPDLSQIRGKLPLLAVCYGAQYLAHFSGGEVAASNTREYGRANLSFIKENEVFFDGVSENSQVWMSHSDSVKALPTNGIKLASTQEWLNVKNQDNRKLVRNSSSLNVKIIFYFGGCLVSKFLSKCYVLPQSLITKGT